MWKFVFDNVMEYRYNYVVYVKSVDLYLFWVLNFVLCINFYKRENLNFKINFELYICVCVCVVFEKLYK